MSEAETEYRPLPAKEIQYGMLDGFRRHQILTKCLRRENGKLIIKDMPFVDDWSRGERESITKRLKDTAESGGFVYAAFCGGALIGFASVDPCPFGCFEEYAELTNIHVAEGERGRGIGRSLFTAAAEWARERGKRKLYISAHSSVESQAFYRSLGCKEAEIYSTRHIEAEPFDIQMEYRL